MKIATDITGIAMIFYKRLKPRDWEAATIQPIFVAVYNKIGSQSAQKVKRKTEACSDQEQVISYLEYHLDDTPRKKVCELFLETCGILFTKIINEGRRGIKRIVLAYSRT